MNNVYKNFRVRSSDFHPLNVRVLIGIGLGIPNLNAGNADQSLLREAIDKTDLDDTEARMLLDKTKHTDYQATDQALLASVAR